MVTGYQELLDAVIQYLEDLKANGQKYAPVSAATMALLDSPIRSAGQPLSKLKNQSLNKSIAKTVAEPPKIDQTAALPVPAPKPEPVGIEPVKKSTSATKPPEPTATTNSPTQPVVKPLITNELLHEPISPIAPVLEAIKGLPQSEAMAELRKRTLICQRCPHLVKARKNVVFGVGNIQSPLMFVGEAPGADEDVQGEPFVGRAGQLLTKIIQAMGFTRDTVYIANILKCRPDTPGQTSGNRKPTLDEMNTCLPYLQAQLNLIKPKVIVALGVTAMEGLLGKVVPITRVRGQFFDFHGTPVMATYHPAYLLRNQSLATKREVWEDMLKVMEKLGCPISEKQRNYFQKAE